jgi:molybdate transport system substrate-binding protein
VRPLVLVVTAALVAGCTGGGGETGRPTVLAAASLTDVFEDLGGARFQFAGSQALVRQVRDGAPADVVATADEASMEVLVDAGLVETPVVFARNELVIAVEPGNPEAIDALDDLGRDDLLVVLADPSVPAGRYAAEALRKAGVEVRARSLELDVRAALTKVVAGEADAAVVYATDVEAADGRAEAVAIEDEHDVEVRYPVAVVADGDRAAGRAFVQRLLGERGRRALRDHGFLVPA